LQCDKFRDDCGDGGTALGVERFLAIAVGIAAEG